MGKTVLVTIVKEDFPHFRRFTFTSSIGEKVKGDLAQENPTGL